MKKRLFTIIIAALGMLLCALAFCGCSLTVSPPDTSDGQDQIIDDQGRPLYTVTFDANGGALTDEKVFTTLPDGMIEAFPTPPTCAGKEFYCWTLAKNNIETRVSLLYKYESNVTLYAFWSETPGEPVYPEYMECVVTFDANGGLVNGVETVTRRTDKDGMLEDVPCDPIRDGYRFSGWYLNSEPQDDEHVAPGMHFEIDTTVYAGWVALCEYTITFDANGGELTDEETIKTDENGKLPYRPSDPECAGYKFDGWYEASEDPWGDKWNNKHVFTADTTLYAKWIQVEFIISFDPNGGELSGDIESLTTGTDGRLASFPPDPIPEDDESFLGWGRDPDADQVVPLTAVYTHDTTLFAIWGEAQETGDDVPQYKLFFHYNYGDELSGFDDVAEEYTFAEGATLVRFPALTRTGYTFVGWGTHRFATVPVTIGVNGYIVTDTARFYAIWSEGESSSVGSDVDNVLPTSLLDDRIYGYNNTEYFTQSENEFLVIKNEFGLVNRGSVENAYKQLLGGVRLVQGYAPEGYLPEIDPDTPTEQVKGPGNIKYAIGFKNASAKQYFNVSLSSTYEANAQSRSVIIPFQIHALSSAVYVSKLTLKTTYDYLPGSMASECEIVIDTQTDYDVVGCLVMSYSCMYTYNFACVIEVETSLELLRDNIRLNVRAPGHSAETVKNVDKYLRETYVVYDNTEMCFTLIARVHAPYVVTQIQHNNSQISNVISQTFIGGFTVQLNTDEFEESTDVEDVVSGNAKYIDLFIYLAVYGSFQEEQVGFFSVKFVDGGNNPLGVSEDISYSYVNNITVDYIVPLHFEFNILIDNRNGSGHIVFSTGQSSIEVKQIIVLEWGTGNLFVYDIGKSSGDTGLLPSVVGEITFALG